MNWNKDMVLHFQPRIELPELVHLKEQGCIRCGQFIVSVIGFGLGFAVLLCIAIYEEQLDSLIA